MPPEALMRRKALLMLGTVDPQKAGLALSGVYSRGRVLS
jgi:hypothetical protein